MTQIQVSLPDELAAEALSEGLLTPERLETWLREQLRKRRMDELFEGMARAAAVPDPPPMSPEEIAEEIRAMRAERRANTAR